MYYHIKLYNLLFIIVYNQDSKGVKIRQIIRKAMAVRLFGFLEIRIYLGIEAMLKQRLVIMIQV